MPTASGPHAALEAELRVLLRRAAATAGVFARRVHPDLEASAYPLLAHIAAHPGVRGSHLAEHFGLGRATISRQLTRLYELGLVQRELDPDDSRGQLISLTAHGLERYEGAHRARVDVTREVLANWPADDVATLADLLRRYGDAVGGWLDRQRPPDPSPGPHEPSPR
jgi:DNA-binding MarR family transcriptional regulator